MASVSYSANLNTYDTLAACQSVSVPRFQCNVSSLPPAPLSLHPFDRVKQRDLSRDSSAPASSRVSLNRSSELQARAIFHIAPSGDTYASPVCDDFLGLALTGSERLALTGSERFQGGVSEAAAGPRADADHVAGSRLSRPSDCGTLVALLDNESEMGFACRSVADLHLNRFIQADFGKERCLGTGTMALESDGFSPCREESLTDDLVGSELDSWTPGLEARAATDWTPGIMRESDEELMLAGRPDPRALCGSPPPGRLSYAECSPGGGRGMLSPCWSVDGLLDELADDHLQNPRGGLHGSATAMLVDADADADASALPVAPTAADGGLGGGGPTPRGVAMQEFDTLSAPSVQDSGSEAVSSATSVQPTAVSVPVDGRCLSAFVRWPLPHKPAVMYLARYATVMLHLDGFPGANVMLREGAHNGQTKRITYDSEALTFVSKGSDASQQYDFVLDVVMEAHDCYRNISKPLRVLVDNPGRLQFNGQSVLRMSLKIGHKGDSLCCPAAHRAPFHVSATLTPIDRSGPVPSLRTSQARRCDLKIATLHHQPSKRKLIRTMSRVVEAPEAVNTPEFTASSLRKWLNGVTRKVRMPEPNGASRPSWSKLPAPTAPLPLPSPKRKKTDRRVEVSTTALAAGVGIPTSITSLMNSSASSRSLRGPMPVPFAPARNLNCNFVGGIVSPLPRPPPR